MLKDSQTKCPAEKSENLYRIILMCKESAGTKEEFVRHVTCAPQISCVLYQDWQLTDLKRFCASKEFGVNIFGVDPTFDCGDFDLTVTTYPHPLLVSKVNGVHPTMMGPMFVHRRKTLQTYLAFFSSLVGDCNELMDLTAFGTDGEQALEKALKMQFRNAGHLRCFVHFKRNIERKLHEIGISNEVKRLLFLDIFGAKKNDSPDSDTSEDGEVPMRSTGLVDAWDEDEFDELLERIMEKWNKLEEECTKKPPVFHKWFSQYKADEVKRCMLASLREAMGLGNPPKWYTTNRNEGMNAVIHGKNHYTAMDWADFCETVRGKVDEQRICFDRSGRISCL